MIDWGSLIANSFWVLGCALGLAVFSYTSWLAYRSGRKLSVYLKRPQSQAGFDLAGIFFCAGLALTVDSSLLQFSWAAMGGFFLIKLVGHARSGLSKKYLQA